MERDKDQLDTLSQVVHASLDAIMVIDRTGRIVEWNPRAEEMFGWPRSEALGRLVHETVIPERLRDKHVAGIERFLETGESVMLQQRLEVVGVRHDGEEFPVELTVTVHENRGEPRFAAFVRDLTEAKKTEQLLQDHQRRLAHVARLNTLSELASGIAHELNQPLTAIANLAATGALSDDVGTVHETLRKIEECVHVAGQLVRRFRKLAAKSAVDRRRRNINEQIREVIALLESELKRESIEVTMNIEDPLPNVFVDEVQIQQVLLNLLRNACEAVVEQRAPHVVVSSHAQHGVVNVVVENSGPKLTDESVFDAFFTTADAFGWTLPTSAKRHDFAFRCRSIRGRLKSEPVRRVCS